MKRLVRLIIVYAYVSLYMLVHLHADEHLYKLEDFIYKMGFVPDVRLPIEGGHYEVHVWEYVDKTE